MQRNRIPLSALTRLGRYDNLLITSLSQTDTKDTTCGLLATVKCKQIQVAQVKMVKVSAMPHVTDSTQKGTLQVKPVEDVSFAYANGKAIRNFISGVPYYGGGASQ